MNRKEGTDHQPHLRTYNEETCTDHDRLHLDVQVHGELDAEVVRVSERLAQKPRPLLADFANLARLVHRQDLQKVQTETVSQYH